MTRILFLFVALFISSMNLSAQDMYRVKADKLNVRATNDPKSKVIGFIRQDENVAVLDSADAKYFKVKVTNGEGWVSKEYLIRVSPVPSKPVVKPAAVATPKAITDNSNLIFFSIVALILITILFFIFKYLRQNRILIAFSTLVVLVTGYFCFITFIKEKVVTGTFASDSDTQYQSFDFKTKDSVVVKDVYSDSLFIAHYVIEGDMIKLQQEQNTILLLIRDENTLIGEGFTKGTFIKK
ncbi:SH3 domain-containing protein [Pedobacter punctiformis]|uniref:SH3 domain-containing protein n=1 Tax=Pedobacter punctiformis TaxID=3004097 RepID=A0ABT4LD53_9SPHI|nr:SH3 domain-containing protein [Pedobacter sp. HCMS5-2]MCZ4244754.1 SH3 domain-containing protein [Pedobacter sp. HCMS5-2]